MSIAYKRMCFSKTGPTCCCAARPRKHQETRRVVPGVGTSCGLERGATEETTGRKPNKANLLMFFGYRQPGRRSLPKPVYDWPEPLRIELGSDHDRSLHDSLTEADAASLHGLAESHEQRTINETTVASRRHERNEAETAKQKRAYVLTLANEPARPPIRRAASAPFAC